MHGGRQTSRKRLTRHELYELVWREPLTKLAPTLGLSDVGLRKVCVRNSIPVPPRGHWAKVAGGRVPRPTPLSKPKENWTLEFVVPADPPAESADLFASMFAPLIKAEARAENRIAIPAEIETPHAMTRLARKALLAAKPDQYGAVACKHPAVFPVRVPPTSVERALKIVDALAKAIEARGLMITRGGESAYSAMAGVAIGEAVVRFTLEETSNRRMHRATDAEKAQIQRRGYSTAPLYDFVPSGVMVLKIDNVWRAGFQTTWKDTATRPLEDRLNEVVAGFYRAAHAILVERRRQEARERRVDAENERRAALRAERDTEVTFLKALESDAAAWARAEALRAHIAAVEHALSEGRPMASEIDPAWIAQAKRHADRIDPLVASPPSALDYRERDLQPVSAWQIPDD